MLHLFTHYCSWPSVGYLDLVCSDSVTASTVAQQTLYTVNMDQHHSYRGLCYTYNTMTIAHTIILIGL